MLSFRPAARWVSQGLRAGERARVNESSRRWDEVGWPWVLELQAHQEVADLAQSTRALQTWITKLAAIPSAARR